MKPIASIAVTCIAGILLFSTSFSGCDELFCGRNSRAVRGAERLDKQYLAQLHQYVASGQCDSPCTPGILDPL
jgi:hypothetical protein